MHHEQEDIEEEVKHMTIRDDDVFINAYIKSGNHWICAIVEAILNENPENAVIHSKARNIELGPIDHPDLFEVGLTKNNRPFSGAHIMENMPLTEQRVMRSHLRPEFMPDMLFETKPKVLYAASSNA
ncbi:amine sulfotransferase-like, partial [Saccoglossus kowalevskii]